ncbi:MAG TPA: DCC1-like thiol-disulfide oxidoreductase family protein [Gemmatimonadales bacterium]|nr:DCC1-like thiol-disulfide oxidoreductase family protein [Gemmatimonadales bacterium]
MASDRMILVYDDECGFCARTVQWVLQRDRIGAVRFAARDGQYGTGLLARHPHLIDVDSVIWVQKRDDGIEEVHSRSDAVLRVAGYLGGGWSLFGVARIIPAPIRDAAYRLIARHRHRLSRNGATCVIPDPGQMERFLP